MTRAVYDASAAAYAAFAGTQISAATEGPIDRSLLAAFVELVDRTPDGRVADVGCGPGRAAAFLAAQGIDVIGVDLSPALLAIARGAHSGIEFIEGQLAALPIADRELAGVVSWYSIIHTPPEHLDEVCGELARVLAPHGHLLMAFQAGTGEAIDRPDAYGTGVSLTSYRHDPDAIAGHLTTAGLRIHARAEREPELPHESTRQAFIIARAREFPAAETGHR